MIISKSMIKITFVFMCSIFLISTLFIGCRGKKAGPEKKIPKLLELGSDKCIPCKKMAPILDSLDTEFKKYFKVEFIDVWKNENRRIGKKYGISTIPTQIFFNGNGDELWRHQGFISKIKIIEKWNELGYEIPLHKKENQNK